MTWRPADSAPCWKTFTVQHIDDIYPVSAYKWDDGVWHYSTDGPEDVEIGDHRHEPLRHQPTHYRELPEGPA